MTDARILAISGGIGGAKLADGLYRTRAPGSLGVVVNTGDDFEHLGLSICPDIDTVTYTLSGTVNRDTGWGRADETWHGMDTLASLGAPTWFRLGDRDLGLHIARTARLQEGESLSAITAQIGTALGIDAEIMPVSDQPIRTRVETQDGPLAFQNYFVAQRCEPVAVGFRYDGASSATLGSGARRWLDDETVLAIVLCPSNPWLSIAPMLACNDFRSRLETRKAPLIAVSPLIGGEAVKGPTAKLMRELGLNVTNATIADYYRGLVDGFVIDEQDAGDQATLEREFDMQVMVTRTLMRTDADRARLAREVVEFATALAETSDAG